MPESRDRLSRHEEEDVIAAYSRRRISRTGDRNARRSDPIDFILEDEEEEQSAVTPFRWRGIGMADTTGSVGVGRMGSGRGGATRTPRIGRGNFSLVAGSGRGGIRRSVLPSWYPRRPLQDITAVMRAIETRRDRPRTGQEDLQIFQDLPSTPGAQPEHVNSTISPIPTIPKKRCPPTIGKVAMILLDVSHQNDSNSANLTPQKKLLNNIDMVGKVVMEELRKLQRTPSAKKAERAKKMRTLMSMR